MFLLRNSLAVLVSIGTLVLLTMFIINSQILYAGPVSDHFDGKSFFYKGPTHTFSDMLKWIWEMKTVAWPKWIVDPPQPKPIPAVKPGELKVTYINHATLLIQMDGVNILTDPIWSKTVGPLPFAGVSRVRSPGVKFEDLPKIDIVLISHDHYDHLDIETLKAIVKKDNPKILAGLGVKSLLDTGISSNVTELDWWQKSSDCGLSFFFVPARHGSGRMLTGENKTLWGGFVIQCRYGNVYFAGDTGFEDFVEQIKDRFGKFRLTLLPIGSYEKKWFMKAQHMSPEDSVKVHKLLESNQSIGYHYATFAEHPEQTIDAHEKDLSNALREASIPEQAFWVLKFGEGRYVP